MNLDSIRPHAESESGKKKVTLMLGVCFQKEYELGYNYQALWTVQCCRHHHQTSGLHWKIFLIRYIKNMQEGLRKHSCICCYCIKCSPNLYIFGAEGDGKPSWFCSL